MSKRLKRLHRVYKQGGNIGIADIDTEDKYYVDKIIYGRLWWIKRLWR